MLLAEGSEAPLLGDGVDVGADDERDEVEEWHPGLLGQELLGEGEADGARNPADAHDPPEADVQGRSNLVDGAGAADQGHGYEVDRVLYGSDLFRWGGKRTVLVIK